MNTSHEQQDSAELDDLVSLLLTASRALVAISASSLAEVEDMLTLSEFRALVVLQTHGPCRGSGLAPRLNVSAEAGGRVAARLASEGFVRNGPDELLELTPQGEQLVARVTCHRRRSLSGIVRRMEEGERSRLVDALIAFASAAGEPIVAGEAAVESDPVSR